MINKAAACDKVCKSEAARRQTGAAGEPKQQPARRADCEVECDRERDRYNIMLDETAEHNEEGRTQ